MFQDGKGIMRFESENLILQFVILPFNKFFKKEFTKDQMLIDYPNEKYVGNYINGRREGYGTVSFTNGNKFTGKFKNGRPTEGTFQYSYGSKIKGKSNKDYEHIGEGILYKSTDLENEGCKIQNGKISTWLIIGTHSSGVKTFFNHLKYLYSYEVITKEKLTQQKIRRDNCLYEIFTDLGKILLINQK